MKIFYLWATSLLIVLFPLKPLSAEGKHSKEVPSLLKQQMLRDLDFIHNNFDAYYAPATWKKEYFSWNLSEEIQRAKEKILDKQDISLADYHKILRIFFNSARDYHVSVHSITTEKASLPFIVKGVKGRYFFVYVNRNKLSKEIFPFNTGDELLLFDGIPVHEVVQEIKRSELGTEEYQKPIHLNMNHLKTFNKDFDNSSLEDPSQFKHYQKNEPTNQALAEIYLTSRRDTVAPIPKGPITLLCQAKNAKEPKACQLVWDYFPEWITDRTQAKSAFNLDSYQKKTDLNALFHKKMLLGRWPHFKFLQNDIPDCKHNLGSRKGFLPRLGEVLWASSEDYFFDAYLFLDAEEHLIAYIRLPHFLAGSEHVHEFANLIKEFEQKTQALVIDQLNNPGGYTFYLYALASMFANHPMDTPKHRMKIGQDEVLFCKNCLNHFAHINNNQEAIRAFGKNNIDGYPVNYQFIQLLKTYCQFILDEWNKGKTMTDPSHLYGVDKIHVSPIAKYTKPVLLLTNELDFSAGDFFPAIMQDNKRAKIMGARTAGAGGYILQTVYPNNLGIAAFSITGSLAERVDQSPIENLGVTPDWLYEITVKDLQEGYQDYKNEILSVLTIMLKKE